MTVQPPHREHSPARDRRHQRRIRRCARGANRRIARITALAARRHAIDDIGATIASGSFRSAGMIVAPCSIRTLSAIAASAADNLLVRAADVHLKERRRLVLMVRESPLHLRHLRAMAAATEIGAIIAPPVA